MTVTRGQARTWLVTQELADSVWQDLASIWTASPVRQQLIQQLTNVVNTRHQNGLRLWHAVFIGDGELPPEDRSLTPDVFLCQVYLFSDLISIFGSLNALPEIHLFGLPFDHPHVANLISRLGVDPIIQNHEMNQLDTVLREDNMRTLVVDTRRNFQNGFLSVCRPVLESEPGVLLVSYLMLASHSPNIRVGQVDPHYAAENQFIEDFTSRRAAFEMGVRPLVPSIFQQAVSPERSMAHSLFRKAWPNFSLYASLGSGQSSANPHSSQGTPGGPGPGIGPSRPQPGAVRPPPGGPRPPPGGSTLQPPQPGSSQTQPPGQGSDPNNSQSRLTKRFSYKNQSPPGKVGLDPGTEVRTRRFIP